MGIWVGIGLLVLSFLTWCTFYGLMWIHFVLKMARYETPFHEPSLASLTLYLLALFLLATGTFVGGLALIIHELFSVQYMTGLIYAVIIAVVLFFLLDKSRPRLVRKRNKVARSPEFPSS